MKLKTKDKFEIAQLCARYYFAVDNQNPEAYLATWVDNGLLEGSYGTARGHQELKEKFNSMYEGIEKAKRHILSNLLIEAVDNSVYCTSYVMVMEREKSAQIIASGMCRDEVVKIEGKWLFLKRRLEMDRNWQAYQLQSYI